MKLQNMMLAFSCIAVVLIFCALFFSDDFKWPDKWQKNMSIELSNYGGMNPETTKIRIYKDSCIYEYREIRKADIRKFRLTDQELNNLMLVLKENAIDKIKTKTLSGVIYDKATTELTFTCGKDVFSISSGSTTSVEEKYAANFFAMVNHIRELSNKKVKRKH